MDVWPGEGDPAWEGVLEQMIESGAGDGLPVVAPTAERVERMLGRHRAQATEVLCELPPLFAAVTWRDVAINAVMAGCRPEYLPVVAAAVEALAAPEFNLVGIATTTGSAATAVIVNGPIAARIGMNARSNALGPGNRANATIGQPAKYGFCFAENEAESPWPPLHVERGFEPHESVVTVVGAAGIVEVVDSSSREPDDLAQTFAASMGIAGTVGGSGLLGGGEPLLVIPPEQARLLAQAGCSKAAFRERVWSRAALPLAELSPAVRANLEGRLGQDAGLPGAEGVLRVAATSADILLVVAGGVGIKAAYVPTWGGSTRAVSRRVAAEVGA